MCPRHVGRIRALYWETERACAAVIANQVQKFPSLPTRSTDRQTPDIKPNKRKGRQTDRQLRHEAAHCQTVSEEVIVKKGAVRLHFLFIISIWNQTDGEPETPTWRHIYQESHTPGSTEVRPVVIFYCQRHKNIDSDCFYLKEKKNVYRFESGRWLRGDNNAAGQRIYVISVLSCWSLCNTVYPEASSNPHTLLLRVTKISADLWHNGNKASIHPTQFCKSRLPQLLFWCVIITGF